jgi:hypothetical protein
MEIKHPELVNTPWNKSKIPLDKYGKVQYNKEKG